MGYTAASVVLKRGYELRGSKPRIWGGGLTRTGIGLGVGLLYGGLWIFALNNVLHYSDGNWSGVLYYVLLLPVRLAERSLLIWIFFDRRLHDRTRMWKYAAFGTICS